MSVQLVAWVVALFGSILFTVLDNKGSPRLGFLRTYTLYLTHGYLLVMVFLAAGYDYHTVLTLRGVLLTAIAFGLSIVICTLSYG